jgi:hypothetical protein
MLFGFNGYRYTFTGSIMVITDWQHYADHQVASLRRSWIGTIALPTNTWWPAKTEPERAIEKDLE